MHKTIDALLSAGREFPGLDAEGNKKVQVCNGINAPKVCIFLGNSHNVDVLGCLDRGREFLKRVLPSLVDETDEEWAEQVAAARAAA